MSYDATGTACVKARDVGKAKAATAADRVIKNTYRTLMSRGLKSCSIYSGDAETREWFDARARGSAP